MSEKLRINWILAGPSLAGGVKSNRLIAEAMARRGHHVSILYVAGRRPWPSPWRVRSFGRRLIMGIRTWGKQRHHLECSTVNLLPVDRDHIRPEDVTDGDVCIASWWRIREAIESWPPRKGLKVHYIRGYEIWGDDPERVRATYRIPALKLVIAHWLQRLMRDEFGDPNAVLVPNGVDRGQFDSDPRGKAPTPTVGMLCASAKWKGCDTAFAALRRVQKQLPSLRVIAYGAVPLARSHRLPANLEYHFRPAQRVIPELYRSADCWVVSSTSEGFGMPGLESAACRCPVVSTRCGGPEDYVEDGVNGRLVPVDDAEAMAEAILEIVNLDEASWRRMSEASYAIARRFDWDRSAETLERALLAALDHQNEGPTVAAAAAAAAVRSYTCTA